MNYGDAAVLIYALKRFGLAALILVVAVTLMF